MDIQSVISLCSGAGGLDLGVREALGGNVRTICYVEHEVTAAAVLVARIQDKSLDNAPIWTDLHTFDGKPWGKKVDGIIGGYPCQPFSIAGKRKGTEDPRHLWPSIERIITECKPNWVFFENVAGHLRLGYFDVVKPSLERLGYQCTEGIFSAEEVGAPHRRERLFILAVDNSNRKVLEGCPYERYNDSEGWEKQNGQSRVSGCSSNRLLAEFPPKLSEKNEWQRIINESPYLSPAIEPSVYRMAHGVEGWMDIPSSSRLRLTGNGVVPQTATLAFITLKNKLAIE